MQFIQPANNKGRVIFESAVVFKPDDSGVSGIQYLQHTFHPPLILNRDELTRAGMQAVVDYNKENRMGAFATSFDKHFTGTQSSITLQALFQAERARHPYIFGAAQNWPQALENITQLFGGQEKGRFILGVEEVDKRQGAGYSERFRRSQGLDAPVKQYFGDNVNAQLLGNEFWPPFLIEQVMAAKTPEDRIKAIRPAYDKFYDALLSRSATYFDVLRRNGVGLEDLSAKRREFDEVYATLPLERRIIVDDLPFEHMVAPPMDVLLGTSPTTQAMYIPDSDRIVFSVCDGAHFKEEYGHATDMLLKFSKKRGADLTAIPDAGKRLMAEAAAATPDLHFTVDEYEAATQGYEALMAVEYTADYLLKRYKNDCLAAGAAAKKVAETLSAAMPRPWAAYSDYIESEKEQAVLITSKKDGDDKAAELADQLGTERSLRAILLRASREGKVQR